LPPNAIPLQGGQYNFGGPRAYALRNYLDLIARTGHHVAEVQNYMGAFDPTRSLVALSHAGYEYSELALISDVKDAPAVLHRKALGVATSGGLTLGSKRGDVEMFFGYSSGAKSIRKCGMVAERFGTLGDGAAFNNSFIFRNDRVVALDYWFGS
jgi:hypothetical protein